MQISEQLVQRFFNGQCTEAERLAVRSYFARFPEMLEEYLTEENWNGFEYHQAFPQDLSEKMFGAILSRTTTRKTRAHQMSAYVAAAAAVLLVAFSGWWIFRPAERKMQPSIAMTNNVVKTMPAVWKFHINTTSHMIRLSLADGSKVELQPGSEIRYSNVFARGNRDIYLKGNALFRVAPHSDEPFTVFAGGLSTTALGTVFRVSEKSNADVCVQLLQGRVVVRADKGSMIKDTYLWPGQQLKLDAISGIASVQTMKKTTTVAAPKIVPKEIYRFSDQPLTAILTSLETSHQLKFVYADSLVNNLSFTGVFDENKESIDDFMNTLCLLNDLIMEKKNDTIRISPVKR